MDNPSPELNIDNLRVLKLLGQGATGTVLLVHDHHLHCQFALKIVEEKLSSNAGNRARREIAVLRRLSSSGDHQPFLPQLIGSKETTDLICWATPLCSGGDMNNLRYRQNDHVFSPAAIRFYVAEIILAIERLHDEGIVYRDLKPENLLVQQSGHVTLTDFDLSRDMHKNTNQSDSHHRKYDDVESKTQKTQTRKQFKPFPLLKNKALKKIKSSARVLPVNRKNNNNNKNSLNATSSCSSYTTTTTGQRSNSFVGTEEYVAPEVIRGDGHEFAVDWWALGVLCYEMLYGKTPFKGRNRKETFQKIVFGEPEITGRPNALTDLIRKLLVKDPTRRLGFRGAWEVKGHEFFKGLRWDMLTEVLRPPFVPLTEDVTEVDGSGVGVREYLERMRQKKSSLTLNSPSRDEEFSVSVSLTEF